jgi:hypothetical protein
MPFIDKNGFLLRYTPDEIATRKDQAVSSFVQAIQKLQEKNTEEANQLFTQAGKFYITSLNEENFEIVGEKLELFESTANETDVKKKIKRPFVKLSDLIGQNLGVLPVVSDLPICLFSFCKYQVIDTEYEDDKHEYILYYFIVKVYIGNSMIYEHICTFKTCYDPDEQLQALATFKAQQKSTNNQMC